MCVDLINVIAHLSEKTRVSQRVELCVSDVIIQINTHGDIHDLMSSVP